MAKREFQWIVASRPAPEGDEFLGFVTGSSEASLTTEQDFATIAYDSATGAKEWTRRFNGADNFEDRAVSIVADPDGSSVFVTGGSSSPGGAGRDYATVAYAS